MVRTRRRKRRKCDGQGDKCGGWGRRGGEKEGKTEQDTLCLLGNDNNNEMSMLVLDVKDSDQDKYSRKYTQLPKQLPKITCYEGSPWLKQGRPTSSDALSSESCRAPSGRDDSLFITWSRKDVNLQIGLLQQLGETVAGHKLGDQPEVQPWLVGHHPVVPLIIITVHSK